MGDKLKGRLIVEVEIAYEVSDSKALKDMKADIKRDFYFGVDGCAYSYERKRVVKIREKA